MTKFILWRIDMNLKLKFILSVLFFILTCCFTFQSSSFAGTAALTVTESDTDRVFNTGAGSLFYFFDLRDRETFIQYTFTEDDFNITTHVQIFDVSSNCNENDFFDTYTPNDTHTYNMRDITTNDGNPSGVVLADNAYGFVVISSLTFVLTVTIEVPSIGNSRIIDENGYEYRTNAQRIFFAIGVDDELLTQGVTYSFNFNQNNGVILSDIIGIVTSISNANQINEDGFINWDSQDVATTFNPFDVDIINNNEVPFSCRDVIYSCVNENNPRLEELLESAGSASVASFEYGINDTIPHSRGGEPLCPGNNIGEGVVILTPEALPFSPVGENFPFFIGFVGLNNGNDRGSMDSIISLFIEPPV